MADDNELTLKDPAAGKKKKLIIIIALAVILLGGGGAGAFLMLSGSENRPLKRRRAQRASPRWKRLNPPSMSGCRDPLSLTSRVPSGIDWCRSKSS